ncbi:MAG: hypothetical protein VKJ04_12030 [Vampirovibrionales bacterium]|nr:hypothetical protein [Vampirovibrionales bacterium]
MSTFAKMIERMEDLVLSGVGIPFTPMTIINSEKLLPQLDRIRESTPEEIRNARRILDQREEIITEAQQRANQLLMDSKKQAEGMLSESELLKAVHEEALRVRQQILTEIDTIHKKAVEEAETLRAKSQEEARLVREGADQYADSVLSSLDKSLGEFHTVVKNGRKHLKQAQMDSHASSHAKSHYASHPLPSPLSPQQSAHSPLPNYSPSTLTSAGVQTNTAEKDRAKIEEFLKQTTLS